MFLFTEEVKSVDNGSSVLLEMNELFGEDFVNEAFLFNAKLDFLNEESISEMLNESICTSEASAKVEELKREVEEKGDEVKAKGNLSRALGWWTLGVFLAHAVITLTTPATTVTATATGISIVGGSVVLSTLGTLTAIGVIVLFIVWRVNKHDWKKQVKSLEKDISNLARAAARTGNDEVIREVDRLEDKIKDEARIKR